MVSLDRNLKRSKYVGIAEVTCCFPFVFERDRICVCVCIWGEDSGVGRDCPKWVVMIGKSQLSTNRGRVVLANLKKWLYGAFSIGITKKIPLVNFFL